MTIQAVNTAPDSPNRIHTEEAKEYGFRGGIVPGLTLYGYLAQALVDRYGEAWLGAGQMEVRFRQPVYDGDLLSLSIEPNGADHDGVDLQITNATGEVVVKGAASNQRDDMVIDPANYPILSHDDDEPLPDGTPETLGQLPVLAEWELDTSEEYLTDYLDQLGATSDVFDRWLHPAAIARVSAYIVGRRFNFGPRIHVAVRSRFLNQAARGSTLTGRGRIVRTWERKGNHYFESNLLVVDQDQRPIMQIDSESLFQLGSGGK